MKKCVIVKEKSENSKTGPVSVTYAPIQTCPKSCPFLDKGCYAQLGHSGIHLNRLNTAAKENKISAKRIAQIEADEIKKLSGERPLRLHIVGDCKTPEAAEILSSAAKEYFSKDNLFQPIWTYTHSWKIIPRDKWGNIISVLASCETLEECKEAMKRGYAASIVRLKPFEGTMNFDGLKMTACKEITKGIKCIDCKLCFNDEKLLENNQVICFFPHGARSEKVRKAILEKEGKKGYTII